MIGLDKILTLCEILALRLADLTITEIPHANLEDKTKLRYSRKLLPYAARFIDLDEFKIIIPFNNRKNVIGFVGRLERDKGIIELIQAIEIIRHGYPKLFRELIFYFIGDGSLRKYILKKVRGLDNVKVLGYVPHNELPRYLNELKLLLLPSKKEGIPTALVEAMACGVIVLATPVGGIPSIIKHGENGFLLNNLAPKTIAQLIVGVTSLDESKLIEISRRAFETVNKTFSLSSAIARYSLIVKQCLK